MTHPEHERALDVDEANEVATFAKDGRRAASVGLFMRSPATVIERIDECVASIQRSLRSGRRSLKQDDEIFLSLQIGCLWGEQLNKALSWEWTCLSQDGEEVYAVASKDRSLFVTPTYFVRRCLSDPNVDCTALLSYNMLVSGRFSDAKPGEYFNVLENVVRIVPRGKV